MSSFAESRIVVAGAGVLGSSIALVLAQAGARVTLADPAPLGENASGVAAGMLAPAFEAILDPVMEGRFSLLRRARELWPRFAERLGGAELGLRRSGAIWVEAGDDHAASLDAYERALAAIGAPAERLTPAKVRGRLPGVEAGFGGVWTGEDWRLSPRRTLAVLRQAAREAGADLVDQRVEGFEVGKVRLSSGIVISADAVVLATGYAAGDFAPELACLTPIKGHILGGSMVGDDDRPVVRCDGGYIVAGVDGLHIGATMETGRADAMIDPAAVTRLQGIGMRFYPALASKSLTARTGVRAATPDGLPLVGPSRMPGVYLATGARRNGWLLAPLVAEMTAAYLAGRDPGPDASLFDAGRFGRV